MEKMKAALADKRALEERVRQLEEANAGGRDRRRARGGDRDGEGDGEEWGQVRLEKRGRLCVLNHVLFIPLLCPLSLLFLSHAPVLPAFRTNPQGRRGNTRTPSPSRHSSPRR